MEEVNGGMASHAVDTLSISHHTYKPFMSMRWQMSEAKFTAVHMKIECRRSSRRDRGAGALKSATIHDRIAQICSTTGKSSHEISATTSTMTRKRTAIVIGAGAGGVSSAARLAKAGFDVTVVEKNSFTGGRCSLIHHDGWVCGGRRLWRCASIR